MLQQRLGLPPATMQCEPHNKLSGAGRAYWNSVLWSAGFPSTLPQQGSAAVEWGPHLPAGHLHTHHPLPLHISSLSGRHPSAQLDSPINDISTSSRELVEQPTTPCSAARCDHAQDCAVSTKSHALSAPKLHLQAAAQVTFPPPAASALRKACAALRAQRRPTPSLSQMQGGEEDFLPFLLEVGKCAVDLCSPAAGAEQCSAYHVSEDCVACERDDWLVVDLLVL